MIILDLKTESIVQVGDLFTVDCSRTALASGDEVDSISLDIGEGFSEIFNKDTMPDSKHVFLVFDAAGTKTLTVKAISGAGEKTTTRDILVLTEEEDRLFSSDEDLLLHEENIHSLLRHGKATFKNIHRLAQKEILRELNEKYPSKNLTKESLVKLEQVRAWSKYLTLHYIYESNIKSADDFHVEKSKTYYDLADFARNNVPISVDTDGDGKEDETLSFRTMGIKL